MMRTLLIRGLIAGLLAGIAAAAFALIVGEPHVDAAIAIEEANAAAQAGHDHGAAAEEPLVSRGVQEFIGMPIASVAFGAAIGGLFSLAFAFVYGRFGPSSVRAYSAVLALFGFVAAALVPFVKYPANPPAVGQPGTIVSRTELYFAFVGISLIAAGVAAYFALAFAERLGRWNAAVVSAGGYLVVVVGCFLVLPSVNEVPADFPASVLWDFRLASLGTLVVLWTVLGLAFGALVHRALADRTPAAVNAV